MLRAVVCYEVRTNVKNKNTINKTLAGHKNRTEESEKVKKREEKKIENCYDMIFAAVTAASLVAPSAFAKRTASAQVETEEEKNI